MGSFKYEVIKYFLKLDEKDLFDFQSDEVFGWLLKLWTKNHSENKKNKFSFQAFTELPEIFHLNWDKVTDSTEYPTNIIQT